MRLSSPMIRATYQAAILSGISNILAQIFQARRKSIPLRLDPFELLRFVLVTLVTAPPNYHWQQFLERQFPAHILAPTNDIPLHSHDVISEKGALSEKHTLDDVEPPMSEPKKKINWPNTFTKMFVDSVTLGAVVNTVAFLVLMGVLKGQNWAKVRGTVGKETIPVIVAGYKIWPMVSLLSFTLVPVERRIVFFSMFGLGWNIYMSIVASKV